jgi:excisionase family DNA binding protein
MTVRQAATALEVSPALVYKLLKAGKLAHLRIGRVIRIEPTSLDVFRRGCQVEPIAESMSRQATKRLVIPDGLAMLNRKFGRKPPEIPDGFARAEKAIKAKRAEEREKRAAESRATRVPRRPNRLLD